MVTGITVPVDSFTHIHTFPSKRSNAYHVNGISYEYILMLNALVSWSDRSSV